MSQTFEDANSDGLQIGALKSHQRQPPPTPRGATPQFFKVRYTYPTLRVVLECIVFELRSLWVHLRV